jgi:uncharacterized protein (UPF0261 family)
MIVIVGTLDTKGDKIAYLKRLIEAKGGKTLVIDSGVLGIPFFQADIPREKVAKMAGRSLDEISSLGDEAEAIKIMSQGTSKIVDELHSSGKLDGLISVGGTMGTSLFLSVANHLPIGVPKVMFSTVAFSSFVKPTLIPPDLLIVPAVSDIWGLNSLTRRMLENAAGAILGATQMYKEGENLTGKTFTAITTLGTSALKYILWLKPSLEKLGNEVALFHVGGGQGWAFEQLVRQGIIKGVLDLCLMDLCPSSVTSRGFVNVPGRLEAAMERSIPQVVAPGALDFYAWPGSLDTLPKGFRRRRRHQHNELDWVVERSLEEVAVTAELIAAKLNKGVGPRAVVIPKLGFSEWDKLGGIFYHPERSKVFSQALKAKLGPEVRVVELNMHINDQSFADEVANLFSLLIGSARDPSCTPTGRRH